MSTIECWLLAIQCSCRTHLTGWWLCSIELASKPTLPRQRLSRSCQGKSGRVRARRSTRSAWRAWAEWGELRRDVRHAICAVRRLPWGASRATCRHNTTFTTNTSPLRGRARRRRMARSGDTWPGPRSMGSITARSRDARRPRAAIPGRCGATSGADIQTTWLNVPGWGARRGARYAACKPFVVARRGVRRAARG